MPPVTFLTVLNTLCLFSGSTQICLNSGSTSALQASIKNYFWIFWLFFVDLITSPKDIVNRF